jgi:hypothetical protein
MEDGQTYIGYIRSCFSLVAVSPLVGYLFIVRLPSRENGGARKVTIAITHAISVTGEQGIFEKKKEIDL